MRSFPDLGAGQRFKPSSDGVPPPALKIAIFLPGLPPSVEGMTKSSRNVQM